MTCNPRKIQGYFVFSYFFHKKYLVHILSKCHAEWILTGIHYRKNPTILDTQKFAVVTLKVEQDDFSLE